MFFKDSDPQPITPELFPYFAGAEQGKILTASLFGLCNSPLKVRGHKYCQNMRVEHIDGDFYWSRSLIAACRLCSLYPEN